MHPLNMLLLSMQLTVSCKMNSILLIVSNFPQFILYIHIWHLWTMSQNEKVKRRENSQSKLITKKGFINLSML